MAQPTGAFSSYDAVGNREDLSDIIHDISPTETPFLSAIGKPGKATGTNHEWQTDALAAASDNAHIEGDDASPSAPAATTRLGNQTQIFKKHAVVTGTQNDGVNPAGRKKEMAYQTARRLKELKLDKERAFIGVNNPKVVGNNTTARECGSLITYLTSNVSAGAGGANPTGDGSDARTDGAQRVFAESHLTSVLQSCFDNGGNPSLLFVGSFNKGKVSGFTGGSTRHNSAHDKKLTASIDVYVGDFHTLKAVPSRQLRSRDVLAIDPEYVKQADMRAAHSYDLAKTGDSYRKEIVEECTIEVCNEGAHALIADLTTS